MKEPEQEPERKKRGPKPRSKSKKNPTEYSHRMAIFGDYADELI